MAKCICTIKRNGDYKKGPVFSRECFNCLLSSNAIMDSLMITQRNEILFLNDEIKRLKRKMK